LLHLDYAGVSRDDDRVDHEPGGRLSPAGGHHVDDAAESVRDRRTDSRLSIDHRFQILPGRSPPSTLTVALTAGPNDFIHRLLTAYNDRSLPRYANHPLTSTSSVEDTSSVEIAQASSSAPTSAGLHPRSRASALEPCHARTGRARLPHLQAA
jgi:hypothetical protein